MTVLALILLGAILLLFAGAVILWFNNSRLKSERSRVALLLGSRPEKIEEAARAASEEMTIGRGMAVCRSRLNQFLASCADPVLLVDENRVIVDLSARAEADLDQPRRRRSLLESLESHEIDEAARAAIDSLKPVDLTVRLYAHGRRPFHARMVPYRVDDGRECLIYLQDVSASVKFGELRSQFAATVSHELRTPLAGIQALVESLQDPQIEPDDSTRFLARISTETNRLSQLVDEILFLSALESGAAESLAGETELKPLVDSQFDKLKDLAAKFEVGLVNETPPGLIVPLSERMTSTVLFNLIDNAVKYSGRGSKVTVRAGREDQQTKVSVSDDGVGIDAEHLPHIFERFYRVDKSRSRRLGGTGLGLSIVKHIVESAGGEVRANSREGFGTEIALMLPRPQAAV